ncbi:YlxR family protein [Kocuria massiliensis]|uniref:YlxR family protein n=1 Tax=Kocuria massiliensis TaxID=1926282 RepID=UPI000A1C9337|nr:YlxR family protein [Kocuria massiliensis]MCT1367858.1 YlxR family protein [Rothia sp. p3-SID1597]
MSSPAGIRTCIGCRSTDDRTALVRVVLQRPPERTGVVVLDPHGVISGRGAWLHPRRQCLDRAVKTKAFARSFRAPVDTSDLLVQWESIFRPPHGSTAHEDQS